MKAIARTRGVLILSLLFVLILAAGCAPNPQIEIVSPELGAQLAAKEAAGVVEALPTPAPLRLADLSEEQITAGLPDDVVAALASADPAHGENLALTNACVGCHSLDPAQVMTGPTWHNVGDTAANRVPGESPGLYLYQSITDPNAYVVADHPANVMPQNYKDTLDTQSLADLISYLLAQHEP